MTTPGSYLLPPEWAAHQRCWMAWPRAQTWGKGWQDARRAYADVANHISEFETLFLLIEPTELNTAKRLISSQIECLDLAYDDAWLRDTAAIFVSDQENKPHAIECNFNGWGNKFQPWNQDRKLASHMAEHLDIPLVTASIIAEGGSIHVDGNGLLITTAQCLQNRNRNSSQSVSEIEMELCRLTGAKHIIWLPEGLEDDHTDGHIDELACFTAPGRLLMLETNDDTDNNHLVFKQAQKALKVFSEDTGIKLDIVTVPQPEARYFDGQRLSQSYVNYYLANDAVIMPGFEQPRMDANAKSIIQEEFPQRHVIQLPANVITQAGGGIHCITQQQPLYK